MAEKRVSVNYGSIQQRAENIIFDDTSAQLGVDNVQDAIDEMNSKTTYEKIATIHNGETFELNGFREYLLVLVSNTNTVSATSIIPAEIADRRIMLKNVTTSAINTAEKSASGIWTIADTYIVEVYAK